MNIGIGLLYFVSGTAIATFLVPQLGMWAPLIGSASALLAAWLLGEVIMWEEE